MSKEQTLFLVAEKALQAVVHQIREEQWDRPATNVPTMSSSSATLTVREIVNRHTYDDLWIPETLAGKTIAEVGTTYDGDLLGPDPVLSYDSGVDAAISAVQALEPDDLAKTVHLSYGDFPASEYLKHIATYRGFRVYSIAKSIGVDSTMPPELVHLLAELVLPEAEQWRSWGVFPPAQAVPDGADEQTELLAQVGFLQD